ncbi:probable BOI-related E3 ubiquitin-protein ligase 2 [Gossypium arboreum]|uniref:probable BOI-related E3 ubiquitin-protein ligase 2 n=1 Tax=Gossypium arboreum TaxID=29729 RepID=UPI0008194AEB|nr:probable BOI-related E3 ubiquitin-protein ligase 2 [Gossypium arboreum]
MAVQAPLYAENMCGVQDWMVNPAPALIPSSYFTLQDPSRYTLPFHLQQNAHNLAVASSSSSSSASNAFVSVALSQSLDAQLEMQRQELDCVLRLQNERLRSALREQRKRQSAILLKCIESKAMHLIRQKEEDLARAAKKTMELEASLRKAETESHSWQNLAKAKEAMIMDLNNKLEQARESLVWVSNAPEDAESLFRDQQEGEMKQKSNNNNKMACKHCNARSSCVVFLPCRHLCSCKSCETFLEACPVCNSIKEASIKVFWV